MTSLKTVTFVSLIIVVFIYTVIGDTFVTHKLD